MAIYNEILVGRYNRFLQKLFDMKGGAVAKQLSGDIQTVIQIFNGVENRYPEGWNRYFGSVDFGSLTNTQGFKLRNPPLSNVIAVIEKILVGSSNASTTLLLNMVTSSTDLPTNVTANAIDRRSKPLQTSGAVILSRSTTSSVTPEVVVSSIIVTPGVMVDYITNPDQELTLLPGDAYMVSCPTLTAMTVNVIWRERYLEASERT